MKDNSELAIIWCFVFTMIELELVSDHDYGRRADDLYWRLIRYHRRAAEKAEAANE